MEPSRNLPKPQPFLGCLQFRLSCTARVARCELWGMLIDVPAPTETFSMQNPRAPTQSGRNTSPYSRSKRYLQLFFNPKSSILQNFSVSNVQRPLKHSQSLSHYTDLCTTHRTKPTSAPRTARDVFHSARTCSCVPCGRASPAGKTQGAVTL